MHGAWRLTLEMRDKEFSLVTEYLLVGKIVLTKRGIILEKVSRQCARLFVLRQIASLGDQF